MRQYVKVTANNKTKLADAPAFTQEDFHGKKRDARNKVATTHEIDKKLILCMQIIYSWARNRFPERKPSVIITSTKRTKEYQLILKEGGQTTAGASGPHVLGIACDFNFTSSAGVDITIHKAFNTDIRDQGPLYQELRRAGMGGIGLYGPSKRNFCHMDTRSSDTPSLSRGNQDTQNGPYSYWKIASPLFNDSVEDENSIIVQQSTIPPDEEPCTHTFTQSTWGLSLGTEINMKRFLESPSTGFSNELTFQDILDYEFEGLSNRERIFNALNLEDRIKFSGNSDGSYNEAIDYPFEVGSSFTVPCSFLIQTKEKGSSENIQNQDGDNPDIKTSRNVSTDKIGATLTSSLTNYSIPYPPIFLAIAKDPGYRRTVPFKLQHQSFHPQCTVYIWCRSLWLAGVDPIRNITADCISVTTSSDLKSGGSFTLELAPIPGVFNGFAWDPVGRDGDLSTGHVVTVGATTSKRFETNSQFTTNRTNEFESDLSVESGENIRTHTDMYYDKLLFSNDVVFIKFEQLEIDKNEGFDIQLADQWYDLMGLIDGTNSNYNGANSIMSVSVQGRCFQKVLNDESGYYNPYSVGKVGSYFGEYADLVSPRSFDGGIYAYRTVEYLTIGSSMEFALYALISNEFVPSACFTDNWSWEDLNHLYLDFSNKDGSGRKIQKHQTESKDNLGAFGLRGIWKKIKLWIDPRVSELIVYDDSISLPEGSIWDHFEKICQLPYVEIITETIGDWFYIIVRQPPFLKEDLLSFIKGSNGISTFIDDTSNIDTQSRYKTWKENLNLKKPKESDQSSSTLQVDSPESYSEFYATEENVDPSKQTELRYIGIEEIKKEVDFVRARYSDLLTSRPPLIELNTLSVQDFSVQRSTDAYTWFEVDTRNMYQDVGGPYGMPIPAVYFNELAQVFGSKRLSVASNYIDIHSIKSDGANAKNKKDLLEKEIAQLLGYLIETHIHLPFTREGTIVLADGDRRIKKGTYVYYQPTDEIFYVDRVVHQFRVLANSTIRTTTLNVSRGMVSKYIEGVLHTVYDDKQQAYERLVSYFTIVDLPKIQELALQAVDQLGNLSQYDHRKPAAVDQAVMNFFLQNRQFDKDGITRET
jgi:hypothetical protein